MRQALSDVSVVAAGHRRRGRLVRQGVRRPRRGRRQGRAAVGDPMRADAGAFATPEHEQAQRRPRAVRRGPGTAARAARRGRPRGRDARARVTSPTGASTAAELMTDRPGLSVVAITGFGATGPVRRVRLERPRRADLRRDTARGPARARAPADVGDAVRGRPHRRQGGLAAVLRARATGDGAFVDCAASEALGGQPDAHRPLPGLGVPGNASRSRRWSPTAARRCCRSARTRAPTASSR